MDQENGVFAESLSESGKRLLLDLLRARTCNIKQMKEMNVRFLKWKEIGPSEEDVAEVMKEAYA
jgi:hypothetical protein